MTIWHSQIFHFKDDLQYEDAVPMLKRLMDVAAQEGLSFGVKLTNTFPVDIKRQELPGEEMYMSGKALFPLSISVAARLQNPLMESFRCLSQEVLIRKILIRS